MANGARQDIFLGTLMGMAIGDALGMPVAGWPAARIAERYGWIDSYFPRVFPDGGEIKAGEFTEESELALCIVESFTVNQGELDPDNIGARFAHLAAGEAARWIAPETRSAILAASDSLDFSAPLVDDGPTTGDVAARGIPIGLIHAVGAEQPDRLRADAELVTRLTHGSPAMIAATTAVAWLVALTARGATALPTLGEAVADRLGAGATATALREASRRAPVDVVARLGAGEDAAAVVATAFACAVAAENFEEAVFTAVNAGGAADSRGAIAGALAGARFGIAGIPQRLIDQLEGRIYVSLAVPWFYRTALRRAGLVIDLRAGT